jgi:hypothetical protein
MFSTRTSAAADRRRIVVGFALALAIVATCTRVAGAQTQPQVRAFTGDVGVMFNLIKADKTADFEMIIGKLKEALAKSENPVRKQQAAGWKVFKQAEPGPNGSVVYIFLINPVVKDADYTVSKILAEAFPNEVQALFQTYSAAYAGGVSMSNYQLVADLGKQ